MTDAEAIQKLRSTRNCPVCNQYYFEEVPVKPGRNAEVTLRCKICGLVLRFNNDMSMIVVVSRPGPFSLKQRLVQLLRVGKLKRLYEADEGYHYYTEVEDYDPDYDDGRAARRLRPNQQYIDDHAEND